VKTFLSRILLYGAKAKPHLLKLWAWFKRFIKTKKGKFITACVIFLGIWWFSLPSELFSDPTSTVILDRDGKLLGAKIATDGQWRFPERTTVPYKFAQCLIQFEDRQFYNHPGVNPVSIFRAVKQNASEGKVVSGGSTITMQVIRMSRKNPPRTVWQKIIEITMATRLEASYSKEEILAMYASHAPFGSNVVGIDAAAWRFFGRDPDQLSWAESATLAVLPNAPSLIYPGKNQEKLKDKRDRLLQRLVAAGIIDQSTCDLSKQEPLPGAPYPLPRLAPHLLDRAMNEGHKGEIVHTSLDANVQERVAGVVDRHHNRLAQNQIHNAAAVVIDVKTGEAIAYVGNTTIPDGFNVTGTSDDHGYDVDCITAPRSTGSILKPFLYCGMLTDGILLPNTLVPDVPTDIAGYNPENFNLDYDGVVPAHRALARSLNVPAVKMLQQYRVERFHHLLKNIGLTTVTRNPDDYGLSLILGGAEGKLWDLAGSYASMARTLNRYNQSGQYSKSDFHAATYLQTTDSTEETAFTNETGVYDAAALWFTFEAMVEVERPGEESAWTSYVSSRRVAWKTGTSFGFRDGWAIGVTPEYVVAVWVGNGSGEGRPGLIGINTAAPIMFDIFSLLPNTSWFDKPTNDMVKLAVCHESGFRALDICDADTMWVPASGVKTNSCPYHRIIHLDATGHYRVNSNCDDPATMKHVSWFILPPSMEYYYKTKNPTYQPLPPWKESCMGQSSHTMEFVYPREETQLYIPVELDGKPGRAVFEVAHRNSGVKIFWHLDNNYIGETTGIHQMALNPEAGEHTLTCVDENGESIEMKFEIISEKKSNAVH
jgi:penicillin-binding protein 1C